jgi:hypothetical protein
MSSIERQRQIIKTGILVTSMYFKPIDGFLKYLTQGESLKGISPDMLEPHLFCFINIRKETDRKSISRKKSFTF